MLKETAKYSIFDPIPKSDKYGIYAMNVGDVIVIKGKASSAMSSVVGSFSKRYDRKYTIRKIDNSSCRIWRIS